MESNLSSIQQLADDMKEFLIKQASFKEKDPLILRHERFFYRTGESLETLAEMVVTMCRQSQKNALLSESSHTMLWEKLIFLW